MCVPRWQLPTRTTTMPRRRGGTRGRSRAAERTLLDNFFAPSTKATKASRQRTLRRIAHEAGVKLYPLRRDALIAVAAILKKEGYRSGAKYILEWRCTNTRLGHELSDRTRAAVRDVVRAIGRGMGPPRRARPVKMRDLAATTGKRAHRAFLTLHTWFMLRYDEAGRAKASHVTVDRVFKVVTLFIPRSKTDQEAIGAERSLKCWCPYVREWARVVCPYHAAVALLKARRPSWPSALLPAPGGGEWSKAKFIELLGKTLVNAPRRAGAWSGHSCRRGGAQFLASTGVGISEIKKVGRWGSAAVGKYVEEVAAENVEEVPILAARAFARRRP